MKFKSTDSAPHISCHCAYTVCSKVDSTGVEGRLVDSGVVRPRFMQEAEVCVQSV